VATKAKSTEPERKQRIRVPKCIPAPPSGEQPYAKKREELKGVTEAEIVGWIMETPEWAEAMRPVLEAVDRERAEARRDPRGGRPVYTAEDIEKALLFQKVCGYRTYKKAHMHLCADLRTREALGFTRPNSKKATRFADGVPSRATISRHLRRFGAERRGDAWDKLARLLRDFHVANFPEMQEEMRVSNTDGTAIKTHYVTPIIDPNTGEIENAESVTCWDGGYMPSSAGESKSGRGWNLIPFLTHTGVPWSWSLTKIHESEPVNAALLTSGEAQAVLALIPERKLGIVTADGAFSSPNFRIALRAAGFIENIHPVSHRRESEERAEKFRNKKTPIEGFPNWFADGHRQIECACKKGHTFARFKMNNKNEAICRVEGACAKCGSITITSGMWRLAKNPARWVRVDPSNPDEEPDYLFGNPFTFDDPLANQFGSRRFGHCEGMFGVLWKRWRLGEKRWFRTVHQARAEVGMVFSIIHVVTMEQRRRKGALAPPGTP
jgi:hypothetical protein